MKRFTITGIIVMALLLFSGPPTPAAETTRWVSSSASAQLKIRPSAFSRTIGRLQAGTEVVIISSDRSWYRVRTPSGREGWIDQQSISDVRPETNAAARKSEETADSTDARDSLSGRLGELLGALPGSSITADSSDASRSIRGLSPEAIEYANQTGTPQQYQNALDTVLELEINENEITTFLKEGKIGEYAE